MSILKNFVNPWESTGELGSQALGTEALEGNVLNEPSTESSVPDIASRSDKIGKGNVIVIIRNNMYNDATKRFEEDKFNKEQLENDNKIWDYIIVDFIYYASKWLKEYVDKYGKFNNIVILSHGAEGGLALGSNQNSWVVGILIDAYKEGKLGAFTDSYKCIEQLEYIGRNMIFEGKILFYGCVGGGGGRYGSVSQSLGEFFLKNKINVIMYFNKNESQVPVELFGSRARKRIPFNEGLTFIKKNGFWIFSSETKPSWLFVDTQDIYSEPRFENIEHDMMIKNDSTQSEPYSDIIQSYNKE